MQARKETFKVALLGVGLGNLPAGRREAQMLIDLHLNFPTRIRKSVP